MPPLLEVRNLTVQFETDTGLLTAVEDVSFTINAGETLGVVGESGSGKSVSSLAILGLLPRSRTRITGSILARFSGNEPIELVGAAPEVYRKLRGNRMAMIFQEPMTSLNPVLRVGDQIAEAIRIHLKSSPREAQERAIEMLDMVGIPECRMRAKAYPHQLSGGMCQRVMIAMALSCEPQLLIADEPTTALDVTIQAQVLELIGNLQEKFGMSVLFISHDLGVVADMADRVVVMYSGRIVEQSDTRTIIERAQHPYSRGLLHSIPRIEGTTHCLQPIRGMLPDGRRRPPGCAFAPRCDYAIRERCAVPGVARTLYECAEAHSVRCERHGEIWPIGSEVA